MPRKLDVSKTSKTPLSKLAYIMKARHEPPTTLKRCVRSILAFHCCPSQMCAPLQPIRYLDRNVQVGPLQLLDFVYVVVFQHATSLLGQCCLVIPRLRVVLEGSSRCLKVCASQAQLSSNISRSLVSCHIEKIRPQRCPRSTTGMQRDHALHQP
jgi:hypothetical protein